MPLSQRKLSSAKRLSETKIIEEENVPTITNLDSGKSDSLFSIKVPLTCTFWELPSWMQDNKDIIRGYRRPTFSYLKCTQSLFYPHNEFVNIWSHLIGAILFVALSFATYFYLIEHYPKLNQFDFVVFFCFMAGAMICLGLSSSFHTMCCHSEKVCANWNRCDYIGIVALILGSICPVIYYGFYCNNILKIVYLTMIFVFGAATVSVAVSPRFRKPEFRWFRTGLFVALGGSSIIPILHSILLYGLQLSFDIISLKWLAITGTLYMFGAFLYGTRIPERFFPGTFDMVGSSHQIFHFFVVAAALSHWYGVIQTMVYWQHENHDCKVPIEEMNPILNSL